MKRKPKKARSVWAPKYTDYQLDHEIYAVLRDASFYPRVTLDHWGIDAKIKI